MDPRLNQLLVPSELERRSGAARRPRSGRRRPRWPAGRSVDPTLFARHYGVTRWY
jgi:hypothetical protein